MRPMNCRSSANGWIVGSLGMLAGTLTTVTALAAGTIGNLYPSPMPVTPNLGVIPGLSHQPASGLLPVTTAAYCPFCSAVNATFAEQFELNHVVVIAKLIQPARPIEELDIDLPKAELEITEIQKGEDFVATGMRFKALLVGTYEIGQEFLVMGVDPPAIVWSTPMKANSRIIEYIKAIQGLPAEGAERLVFFQKYFEDPESVLAYDAYDEFAKCKYSDLIDLKPRMDRPQLLQWIDDKNVPINRRRLYLTMLGVCGDRGDAAKLEEIMRSDDRERQAGLDALVASYLMLTGPEGLQVVDEIFVDNPKVEDLQLLSVRSALAFHSTEVSVIERERLLVTLRKFLNNPKIADAVIPDLARLKDWSVAPRLMELFRNADSDTKWVRVPIVQFFQACPLKEAKDYLEELKKLDPDSVKRASFLSDFDFGDNDGGEDLDDDRDKNDKLDDDNLIDDNLNQDNLNEPAPPKPAVLVNQLNALDQPSSHPSELDAALAPHRVLDESVVTAVQAFRVPWESPETIASSSPSNPGSAVDDETAEALTTTPVNSPVSTYTAAPAAPSVNLKTQPEISAATLAKFQNLGAFDASLAVAGTSSKSTAAPSATALTAGPASSPDARNWGLTIVAVPAIASLGLLALIWSVISGWFERLIF